MVIKALTMIIGVGFLRSKMASAMGTITMAVFSKNAQAEEEVCRSPSNSAVIGYIYLAKLNHWIKVPLNLKVVFNHQNADLQLFLEVGTFLLLYDCYFFCHPLHSRWTQRPATGLY